MKSRTPHLRLALALAISFSFRAEHHVLKPSALFQGVYEVWNNAGKSVEVEGKLLRTTKGFPKIRKSQIMQEELFYNKEYEYAALLPSGHSLLRLRLLASSSLRFKPYRVIVVSKPLLGAIHKRSLTGGERTKPVPSTRDIERSLCSSASSSLCSSPPAASAISRATRRMSSC